MGRDSLGRHWAPNGPNDESRKPGILAGNMHGRGPLGALGMAPRTGLLRDPLRLGFTNGVSAGDLLGLAPAESVWQLFDAAEGSSLALSRRRRGRGAPRILVAFALLLWNPSSFFGSLW